MSPLKTTGGKHEPTNNVFMRKS